MITVSHDRYFLDNVVDRIFELDGNGHAKQYEGGYTDYLAASSANRGAEQLQKRQIRQAGLPEERQKQKIKKAKTAQRTGNNTPRS